MSTFFVGDDFAVLIQSQTRLFPSVDFLAFYSDHCLDSSPMGGGVPSGDQHAIGPDTCPYRTRFVWDRVGHYTDSHAIVPVASLPPSDLKVFMDRQFRYDLIYLSGGCVQIHFLSLACRMTLRRVARRSFWFSPTKGRILLFTYAINALFTILLRDFF